MKTQVDTAWFKAQLANAGLSVRSAARLLGIHASALSRSLNGERRFKLEEVRRLADAFAVSANEVMARATSAGQTAPGGFGEPSQAPYGAGPSEGSRGASAETARRKTSMKEPHPTSPLFGCLKGIMVVSPGVDLTQPTNPEWGKVHDD